MLSSSAADDTCFDAHNLLLHKVHPNNVILVKQMWEEDKQKVESLNRKETNYHPSLHGIFLLGYIQVVQRERKTMRVTFTFPCYAQPLKGGTIVQAACHHSSCFLAGTVSILSSSRKWLQLRHLIRACWAQLQIWIEM